MAYLRTVYRSNLVVSRSISSPSPLSVSVSSGLSGFNSADYDNGNILVNYQSTRGLCGGNKHSGSPSTLLSQFINGNFSTFKQNLHSRRELNSSAVKSTVATKDLQKNDANVVINVAPEQQQKPQRDPLDLSFNDPIAAFKSKTTSELVRAYFVYTLCSSEYLVENNMKVIIVHPY